MEKYDKIYIPHDPQKHGVCMDDNYHVSHEGFAGPTGPPKEVIPRSNVIVLTIEEISEFWEAAKEYGSDVAAAVRVGNDSKIKAPGFFEYMESKGINL